MTTLSLSLVIVAAALLVLERIPALQRRPQRVFRPGVGSDLLFLFFGFVLGSGLALDYVVAASRALGGLGVVRMADSRAPFWVQCGVALLLLDLGNYLVHLLLHRSQW